MTVEEIDIIVQAKVEEALKNIDKLVPELKKKIKQIQEAFQKTFSDIDMSKFSEAVDKAVELVNKKLTKLRKTSNTNMEIKINNDKASKTISQTEKEVESLQKQISSRS